MNFQNLLLFLFFATLFSACSGTTNQEGGDQEEARQQLKQEINALEAYLKSQDGNQIDKDKATLLIDKSQEYARQYPDAEDAPSILFRAADVSRGIGKYGRAIQIWGTVMQKYPSYERTPDALFLTAFTYENNLREKTQAKNYYKKFMADYPDHPFYQQVKQSLELIDKSPEELVKEFQRKNKEDND